MALRDFFNKIKETTRNIVEKIPTREETRDIRLGVQDKLSRGVSQVKSFQQKAADFLSGEDEEYRALRDKYETPFMQQANDLIAQWKQGRISEQNLNSRSAELRKQQEAFSNTPEGQKYREKKQDIMFNYGMNFMGAGLATKISGPAKKMATTIAKSNVAEEILGALKKFKVSDEIAEKLSKRLVNVTDEQAVYRIVKSGQEISNIEKKVGQAIDKQLRSKLAQSIDHIYKTTVDQETEKLALKKISDDFIGAFKKNAEKKADEAIAKLPENLKSVGKLIKESKTKDELVAKIQKIKTVEGVAGPMEEIKKTGATVDELFNKVKNIVTEIPRQQALKEAKQAKGKLRVSQTKKVVREKTGQIKQTVYETTEEKLLREKMRTAQIYSKIGKAEGIKSTSQLRKAVRRYAEDLPVRTRQKLLSRVKFSELKTKKQLKKVLDDVDIARTKVKRETARREVLREVIPLRKVAREKGLIGKIKMQVRKELGITSDSMMKTASKKKLERYKEIIKEVMDTTPKKREIEGVDWKKVSKESGVGSSKGKTTLQKVGEGIESGLGIISSNIEKYGGAYLKSAIRERRKDINVLSKRAADQMQDFQKGISKMKKKWFGGKAAYEDMAHALYSQDFDSAREIAKKYKFEKGFEKIVGILDDIQERANAVGLKVGKLQNYFPRIVKDYDGLFAAYNKKFGKEDRTFLDKLLSGAARNKSKLVSELTAEEKSDILTKALRGYGQGKINVGNVQRARQSKELPVEFMKFYHTPEDALVMYVSKMNEKITLKKLFGLDNAEQETLGSLIEKMDISPNDMYRLKESLGAILAPQGQENWALNKVRKSATLTLLSSISSTLFQIADIGVNWYKHGLGRAIASLFRKKPIKRDELFTDIAHEFADSTIIKNSLKAIGFDRLDRLNSEAFMGNAFREATRLARKGKGKAFKEMEKYADIVFRGDAGRIAKFMDDIKAKKVTDDTRLYVFNKILDVSPRVMEEMPEAYAKNPNARIFYSMKSYGIKILDIYRNDVVKKWKESPRKSAKNFIKLTAILTVSGATGAQIRDWYNGKDTKFSDNIVNNMLQIMLLSTYDAANIQRDGLGRTILNKALPPSRWLDDISRDVLSAGDGKGLYSLRDIPIVGTELYNRVGRGKETIEKANAKASTSFAIAANIKGGQLTTKQKQDLAKLKKENPAKYSRVVKQIKWEKMGITEKEQGFASMGVADGERAKALAKYFKKDKDWKKTYGKLKKAGIITEDVEKQLRLLLK